MIRLMIPTIEDDDMLAVRGVLASGFLVQGEKVAGFERSVADYVGVKHAIAVSNCTAALHLSLLSIGVGPGDLVIVPTYSFVATANVIECCGAKPVFIDILKDTFNIDPELLKVTLKQLLSNKDTKDKVKAIIPVHAFGQMADMTSIMEIAKQFAIPVIEDAACALGASHYGKQAGTWGTLGCFSFHPRKAITTGEGGIIVTNDSALNRMLRALRNHGLDPDSVQPDFIVPGYNYRMTEFQAALGLTQMNKIQRIIQNRTRLALEYDKLLAVGPLQTPVVSEHNKSVHQSYVILLPSEKAAFRKEIISKLKEQGIEVTIGTWHMPLTTHFRTKYKYKEGDFPVTDMVFSNSLTLPLFENMSIAEQETVVEKLQRVLDDLE